jgi:2-methylcitrate dehydratase PrpD
MTAAGLVQQVLQQPSTTMKYPSRRDFCVNTAIMTTAAAAPLPMPAQTSAPPPTPPAVPTGARPDVTRALARFVATTPSDVVPAAVRAEAVRSVVNWLGCALGGARHETTDRAVAAVSAYSLPQATLLGRTERLDPLKASFINGLASHVLDFDDTHLRTIIHPAGPVLPALLALAEQQVVRGRDFLHAFLLGVEVECRLGEALYPSHYEMGWHITGTCGVFGAAAAAGKLLGLTEQQLVWALGIAASEAAGVKAQFGSMTKSFHVGRAAENGLLAALLARRHFTSSERALEGRDGYLEAAASHPDVEQLVKNLGGSWEITANTYKPYACGIVIHPTIDGVLQLRREGLVANDVEQVSVRAHPLVLQLTGQATPATGMEGKFSVYHAAAVALVRGSARPKEFTDAAVRDPQVMALRQRVRVRVEPAIHEDEAFLTVTTRSGRTIEKHVRHAVGSRDQPMSNTDLESKFRQLAEEVLPAAQAARVLELAWKVEGLSDTAELARAAAAAK